VPAKSIGVDKPANHDLSNFKNGKTNRTAKSSKHNEGEVQNSQYQDARVRYNNLANDGNSKNGKKKDEYKQFSKNVNSKEDLRPNDRDYSAYMDNENMDGRNAAEDQFNIHQVDSKNKVKIKLKVPIKNNKLKKKFQINKSSRKQNQNQNQNFKMNNSNSQVNNYDIKIHSTENSDESEENQDSNGQINDLDHGSEQIDQRRVRTDFGHHNSNDKHPPIGKMVIKNMFENPKEDKIRNKVKNRRNSNFDFDPEDSPNNYDELMMNAENQIDYEYQQMMHPNPSYPEKIEGRFKKYLLDYR
jgi:hypothetical protein